MNAVTDEYEVRLTVLPPNWEFRGWAGPTVLISINAPWCWLWSTQTRFNALHQGVLRFAMVFELMFSLLCSTE